MPEFSYIALEHNGEKISGSLKADGKDAVLDHLSRKGLRPVSIEIEQDGGNVENRQRLNSFGRVSQGNVEVFLRQLSNLLTAGIPLNRAIEIIIREVSHPAVKRQWNEIRSDVVGGESLAAALAKWPKSFPPVYVAMVRAGETGGFLSIVLEQIADFKAREHDLKGRVKAALIYPALLVVMASVVLAFLMVYFIPQFASIFKEFGGALPLLTRLIMSFSKWVVKYGVFLVAGIVAFAIAINRTLSSKAGKKAVENIFIGIPFLGAILARFGLVRFCRMLGTLLEAGVSLVASLNVAREAIGNQAISDAVGDAIDKVKNGISLARGLSFDKRLFPSSVIEMIAVAEESGRLDKELLRLAGTYESELDRQLRMLVAIIEPVLLFVMAGIVGTVVIGMLLPIFTLQELIR